MANVRATVLLLLAENLRNILFVLLELHSRCAIGGTVIKWNSLFYGLGRLDILSRGLKFY